jgi:membrane protein implicated in regulation of membrane protease activity
MEDIGSVAAVSSWSAGLTLGMFLLGVFLLVAFVVVAIRWRRYRGISGIERLVGAVGTVKAKSKDGVIVHARSDNWWVVESPESLQVGQKVEITAVEGLRVRVRALETGTENFPKKRGGKS